MRGFTASLAQKLVHLVYFLVYYPYGWTLTAGTKQSGATTGLFVKLTVNGRMTSDCQAPRDLLQLFRGSEAVLHKTLLYFWPRFLLYNIILDFAYL